MNVRIGLAAVLLALAVCAGAQTAATTAKCGKPPTLPLHPDYLLSSDQGTLMVESPRGWVLDRGQHGPFYFVQRGETYDNARTLMYINVEPLDDSLRRAVQRDTQSFGKDCQRVEVRDLQAAELLESACPRVTQMFSCVRPRNPYVDLVTKIAIHGALLNVVLSADNAAEIARHRADYDFLLKHMTMF